MKVSLVVVSNSEIISGTKSNTIGQICSSLYKNRQEVVDVQTIVPSSAVLSSSIKQAMQLGDAVIVMCENEWDKFYMCKKVLCDIFETKMQNNEYAKKYIDEFVKNKNIPLKKEDSSLFQMPEISRAIKNPFSAFQGCLMQKDKKSVFLLPLNFDELYHIFFSSVLPFLLSESNIKGKTYILRTFGIKSSDLNLLLRDEIKNKYNIEIVCSECLLRGEVVVSIKENTRSDIEKNIISKIYTKLLPYFYSEKDQSLEEFIFDILSVRGLTISIAEDFTCGNMTSNLFKNLPDAHQILHESYVAISSLSKIKLLGVDKKCFSKTKIDNAEIAYQMALGVLENSGADVVIANCGDLKTGDLTFAIGNSEGIHIFNQKIEGSNEDKIAIASGTIFFQLIKKLKQDNFQLGQQVI